MKLPQSILYPIVILFTLGAIFSFYVDFGTEQPLDFLAFFLIIQFLFQRAKAYNRLKSLLLYLSFFALGCIYFQAYYRLPSNHFQFEMKEQPKGLKTIEIEQTLGQSSFSNSYIGRIIYYGKNETDGTILINQKKDSFVKPYSIGQRLITYELIQTVRKPPNPGDFSFKNYLENQRVYYQISVHRENSIEVKNSSFSLKGRIQQLRKTLLHSIQNSKLNTESKGMIQALLLAQRKALNTNTIESYAKAGVIHLLALSGLHIGIFVGLLWMVFRPFLFWQYGHILRTVAILFFLWSYAFLIGFPASVVRAVTLFSFIVIGKWIHSSKNTFHYTVLSFWILILIYPPYLRTIGFQMSYLAVFGILVLYPIFKKLWNPKIELINKLWEWTAVCLSAQIAVSPLSIYYFHQFPSLFLVSNLLIIPFFGIFLCLSLFVFLILLLIPLPQFVVALYELIVSQLNQTVLWVAQQERFLFQDLFQSLQTTIILYGILVVIIFWFYKKNVWRLSLLFICIIMLLYSRKQELKHAIKQNSIWIFHQHNQSLLGHQKRGSFFYFTSDSIQTQGVLNNFITSRNLKEIRQIKIENFYIQGAFRMLILNNDLPYSLPDFKPSHLLLRNNPKLNVDRLLEKYHPKMVISDGSNLPWNVKRWKESCRKNKVLFYNTREKGALKINL